MKYVKSGSFTTKQLSISETITEISDVINIAKDIIQKIKNDDSKELDLALTNLNQSAHYLEYIQKKANIALKYVPINIQEKEYL
ncbi:MAG: hypothetical protein J6W41_03550 [Alphaproteobacteria bacterium]|nr:hypothetical protein [Alphaproteobacteria bacterium]